MKPSKKKLINQVKFTDRSFNRKGAALRPQINNNNHGTSLIEVMVVAAILPILFFAAMDIFKSYVDSGKLAKNFGENEDARTYIRTNLDCQKTFIKEGNICNAKDSEGKVIGGYIKGYDQSNTAIGASEAVGRDFLGTKVRTHCLNDGIALVIRSEIKRPGSDNYEDLKGIPITCKICGVDVASLPATFPPPPIPAGAGNLVNYINSVTTQCGEPGIPHDALVQSYSGSTRLGKTKPFYIGTIHTPTLQKVCEMLGFATVVSSSCVENAADYRCNFTSPYNNALSYWDGTKWVLKQQVEYYSWLSSITCTDPL